MIYRYTVTKIMHLNSLSVITRIKKKKISGGNHVPTFILSQVFFLV